MALTNPVVDAPGAVGPYSQAIKFRDLLFVSGNIPLDPATGDIVPGGIEEQAKQVLKNLRAVVEASGSDLGKVVKTTVSVLVFVHSSALRIQLPTVTLGIPQVDERLRYRQRHLRTGIRQSQARPFCCRSLQTSQGRAGGDRVHFQVECCPHKLVGTPLTVTISLV